MGLVGRGGARAGVEGAEGRCTQDLFVAGGLPAGAARRCGRSVQWL